MFHTGLSEFKPEVLSEMETIPISYFPKRFNYYAGGHIHKRGEYKLPGYDRVIFPGPLFLGYGSTDIENFAKGEARGFFIVDFDGDVTSMRFVDLNIVEGAYFEYDATGKNSMQVAEGLKRGLDGLKVEGKLVAFRVSGNLSGGKPSDVNFAKLSSELLERGAVAVNSNRFGFKPGEREAINVVADDIPAIESKLFAENIGSIRVNQAPLNGQIGADLAKEFLKLLRTGQAANQSKKVYNASMASGGARVLGLEKVLDEEIA